MIEEKNRSFTYILPLIAHRLAIHKKALINSYVYNTDFIHYNEKKVKGLFVVISYSWAGKEDFRHMPECKQIIDINSNYFMVYLETSNFDKDIKLILEAKYSKISTEAKKIIKEFFNLKLDSNIINILFKREEFRVKLEEELDIKIHPDAELGNPFNMHKEVFSNKIIKQIVE